MFTKQTDTYEAKIYIAGAIEVAKQVIREECLKGLCVTIEPTHYIYTQGEEVGYVVGLINYPRFPASNEDIYSQAVALGMKLLMETYQGSFTIVATDKTEFFSIREADKV